MEGRYAKKPGVAIVSYNMDIMLPFPSYADGETGAEKATRRAGKGWAV